MESLNDNRLHISNEILSKLILIYVLISSFTHIGIEYLYENHLLKHDPQDVAQFLYKGEGLNKTAIGNLFFLAKH